MVGNTPFLFLFENYTYEKLQSKFSLPRNCMDHLEFTSGILGSRTSKLRYIQGRKINTKMKSGFRLFNESGTRCVYGVKSRNKKILSSFLWHSQQKVSNSLDWECKHILLCIWHCVFCCFRENKSIYYTLPFNEIFKNTSKSILSLWKVQHIVLCPVSNSYLVTSEISFVLKFNVNILLLKAFKGKQKNIIVYSWLRHRFNVVVRRNQ